MAENKVENKSFEIVIDDGSQRVSIKNTYGEEIGVFYFRPTDLGIVDRYNKMVGELDKVFEPLEKVDENEGQDSNAEFTAITEAKDRLYEALDNVLGGNVSEAFFGKMHPFSPVNGSFYCELALENLGKYIDSQFEVETTKFKKRVEKYTKRYAKK